MSDLDNTLFPALPYLHPSTTVLTHLSESSRIPFSPGDTLLEDYVQLPNHLSFAHLPLMEPWKKDSLNKVRHLLNTSHELLLMVEYLPFLPPHSVLKGGHAITKFDAYDFPQAYSRLFTHGDELARTPNTTSTRPVALWYLGEAYATRQPQLKSLAAKLHKLAAEFTRHPAAMADVTPVLAQLVAPPGFKAHAVSVTDSVSIPAEVAPPQGVPKLTHTASGKVRNLTDYLKARRAARVSTRAPQVRIKVTMLPDAIRLAQDALTQFDKNLLARGVFPSAFKPYLLLLGVPEKEIKVVTESMYTTYLTGIVSLSRKYHHLVRDPERGPVVIQVTTTIPPPPQREVAIEHPLLALTQEEVTLLGKTRPQAKLTVKRLQRLCTVLPLEAEAHVCLGICGTHSGPFLHKSGPLQPQRMRGKVWSRARHIYGRGVPPMWGLPPRPRQSGPPSNWGCFTQTTVEHSLHVP